MEASNSQFVPRPEESPRWGHRMLKMEICNNQFEGPYTNTNVLRDMPGVYVILGHNQSGVYRIIDVGESSTVHTRITNHDRVDCWTKHAHSQLYVAVKYIPRKVERKSLERKIRNDYAVPCGA